MAWFLLFFGALVSGWGFARAFAAYFHYSLARAIRGAPRRLPGLGQRLAWWGAASLALACAVSTLFLGNPVFGLGALAVAPLALPRLTRYWSERQAAELDASAIAFFHALRGLVRAGLGLPYALFRLSEALPSPFSRALRPFLDRFENGRALELCLERFRGKLELRLAGICLSLLQMAYREGLPVAPFLDRILPLLEAERTGRERVRSLRRSVALQAAVAFLTPWGLAAVMAFFQPEVAQGFWTARAAALIAVALGVEALGVWVLWQVSTFC